MLLNEDSEVDYTEWFFRTEQSINSTSVFVSGKLEIVRNMFTSDIATSLPFYKRAARKLYTIMLKSTSRFVSICYY